MPATLQRGDGCGILFCIQRGARRGRRIPSVVNVVKCALASNPKAAGPNMRDSRLSRRDMLKASTVLAAGAVFAEPLAAAAPEPTPLSAAMIQAARKEGTLAFYTAMELPLAEGLSKAFEAKYPGIKVRVKRSGAERVFQRIGEEEEIRIHEVDVVCSTDAGHFVRWRREGLLAPFLPEDAARHLPPRTDRYGWHVRDGVRLAQPHHLQHQSGQARGYAVELRRSARPPMAGQNRQGTSRL